MDKISLGNFTSGMDNTSFETSLEAGSARYLENLLVHDGGSVHLRPGYTTTLEGEYHSGFSTKYGTSFMCKNTEFGMFDGADFHPIADLGSWVIRYVEAANRVYLVTEGGVYFMDYGVPPLRRAGVMTPPAPEATAGDGALPAGRYAVGVTVSVPGGEESPMSDLSYVDVVTGGIVLRSLPQAPGMNVNIYTTTANGEELFRNQTLEAVVQYYIVGDLPSGESAKTIGLERFGGGEHIAAMNGRLFKSKGPLVTFSEPMRLHLTRPGYDYVMAVGDVTILAGTGVGLVVGDSKGVWLYKGDDISDASRELLDPDVAYVGSSIVARGIPVDEEVSGGRDLELVWVTASGFKGLRSDGQCVSLNGNRVSFPEGLFGGTYALPYNGRTYLYSLVKSPSMAGMSQGYNSH